MYWSHWLTLGNHSRCWSAHPVRVRFNKPSSEEHHTASFRMPRGADPNACQRECKSERQNRCQTECQKRMPERLVQNVTVRITPTYCGRNPAPVHNEILNIPSFIGFQPSINCCSEPRTCRSPSPLCLLCPLCPSPCPLCPP